MSAVRYTLLITAILCTGATGIFGQTLSIENIWKYGTFSENTLPGFNFMRDGRHYTRQIDNKIAKYDIVTGTRVDVLFDGDQYVNNSGVEFNFSSYSFSSNEKLVLLAADEESIYRRSTRANYFIFNSENNQITPLYVEGKTMYATFSPDESKVAFVFENNIYYKDLSSGEVIQVTTDGKINEIINGAADWVYEEEFSLTRAFEWSPDNQKIAFMRFDEREVPEFTMDYYADALYPYKYSFKYPKVGQKNAKVDVFIYHLEDIETVEVQLPPPPAELYVPRIDWTTDPNRLCVTTMNRHQNNLQLFLAKAKNGRTSLMLDERDRHYIELHDNLVFLKDGQHFIWSSEKEGYNHIYLYRINGREKAKLTSGNFDVTKFYGVDEQNEYVYYQAAKESPMTRGIYRVKLDGDSTITMQPENGTHSANFSPTFDYYIDHHSTINSPTTFTLYKGATNEVRVMESNEELMQLQKEMGLPPFEFMTVHGDEGTLLNAFMLKPPNFDPAKEYPLLMYVYGGPGSQEVVDKWMDSYYWWFQKLAREGYMVACVDNRGTGARGAQFKKMTYLELGKFETQDQIAAARYFGNLPYVASDRIGIFGWSYGGYMSSLAILKGNDVFSLAVAVAPVTNWKWYDTIYTERYMRTEEENKGGYQENSPIYFADRLKGDYLIAHGLADDNVHAQHTIEMTRSLILAGKQFDMMMYPNDAHGINGPGSRAHLFTRITNFILENL